MLKYLIFLGHFAELVFSIDGICTRCEDVALDLLSKQIAALSSKIDSLYLIVEQLNQRLSQAIDDGSLTSMPRTLSVSNFSAPEPSASHLDDEDWVGGSSQAYASPVSASLEHKDVLVDDGHRGSRNYSGERFITTEVQIQRLTAQLTAAYNQIAALEERLLAHHSH